MDKTNAILLELVREYGADLVTAKLHHFKQFRNLPALDVAQWALGKLTPSNAEIKQLETALPRIKKQLHGKKREYLPPPENG